MDSTGVLELVMFVEETFNITVEGEEITPEDIGALRALEDQFSLRANRIQPCAR